MTLRKPTDPPILPTTLAEQQYEPKSVPKRDITWSLATGKPIPHGWLPQVLALVGEQRRIGVTRDPATFSQMEALVLSKGMLGAEEARDRGADQLGDLVDRAATIKGEIDTVRAQIAQMDAQPLTGMNGDIITTRSAGDRMIVVSAIVTEERDAGSVKHRRVPVWAHRFATWAPLADFFVLLYFLAQVFNVDLAGLSAGDGRAWGESLIGFITSIVFALLGTAAVAVGLKFIGHDLKGYKDEHGHVEFPEGQARSIPLLFVGLASLLAIGAGIVMAYRLVSDSVAAGGSITGAVVLGVFFAVVVIVVNVVVVATRFRDGSLQTDEIGHLATQLAPIQKLRVDSQRRIDSLTTQLPPLMLKAERVYAATLARMGTPLKGADQVRLLARSYHQGCGAEATFSTQHNADSNLLAPQVAVDYSVLNHLLGRLGELVAESETSTEGATSTTTPTSTPEVPKGTSSANDEADDLGGEW
ncbi:hypothetical protein BOX37_07730 [Nocardia mangyaensis]|uniref:Uncharacterized protein n=1 Tax=Nocardia mangyaensis TaxID=2213200 RepID=A0A1J0VPD1_9NOCA|nr:hypothetical protein BOX37_07730 [Nocardia mangyaensis]